MEVRLNIRDSGIDRFRQKLENLGTKGEIAMVRAFNDAGDQVRTQVRKALKDQTGVLHAAVINANVTSRPASQDRSHVLTYDIEGHGKGLGIRNFAVQAAVGSPVTAMVWGVPVEFQRSFMTSKKGLLLARRGADRKPIRSLFGPAIAKEIVKGQSAKTFEHAAGALVEPVMVRRLAQLVP